MFRSLVYVELMEILRVVIMCSGQNCYTKLAQDVDMMEVFDKPVPLRTQIRLASDSQRIQF